MKITQLWAFQRGFEHLPDDDVEMSLSAMDLLVAKRFHAFGCPIHFMALRFERFHESAGNVRHGKNENVTAATSCVIRGIFVVLLRCQ